jgi:hypothetical protein
MHNNAINQEQVSDMQLSCRASLDQICSSLRVAGFKIDGAHAAYRINGESLFVFASISQPVDTVLYFLQSYDEYELQLDDSLANSLEPRKLMIQVNNGTPVVYADNINTISYTPLSTSAVQVSLTVQPLRADEKFVVNEGFRMHTETERVKLRNLDI